jgi:hypothetical protein
VGLPAQNQKLTTRFLLGASKKSKKTFWGNAAEWLWIIGLMGAQG